MARPHPPAERARLMRAAVLVLIVLGGCERERRVFSQPSPSDRPVVNPPMTTLHAGLSPIAGDPLDPAMTGYQETAAAQSQGQALYAMFNCVGCHANGGGAIGPAFIDKTWRYGSSPEDVAVSIISGRPEGMPSYRGKLQSTQLFPLVVYVRSLGGLVRTDAVSSRTDHAKSIPTQTLENRAIPHGSQESP
jgi:cytochrome c oxidase cbb3-type subunit 3